MNGFTRICLKCNSIIKYRGFYAWLDANKENVICKKCASPDIIEPEKPLVPDILERTCPCCNRIIHYKNKYATNRALKANKNCNQCSHPYKNKTYEEIFGYEEAQKYKKRISEQSAFSKTGANNIRIKKFLEEHNLSYNEYIKKQDQFKLYCCSVDLITERQPIHLLPNYDNRGNAGTPNAYHLDHKIEKFEGWQKKIPAEIIGDISNLQFITWEENLKKRYNTGLQYKY